MRYKVFAIFLLCLATSHSCTCNRNEISADVCQQEEMVTKSSSWHYSFSFLGHDVVCEQDSLASEWAKACESDSNITIDLLSGNITLYGVTFHINESGKGSIALMSSVEPDSRQVQGLVKTISRFHGKAYDNEPYSYCWPSFYDERTPYQTNIRLRRIRTDFGGTVIFIEARAIE